MRLIDADKFKDYIVDGFEQNKDLFNDEHIGLVKVITCGFLKDIDEQPTAYDIDKVIEQLEKRANLAAHVAFEYSFGIYSPNIVDKRYYGMVTAYAKAIEIVKKGGKE